jgi:hypothetical protein
MTGWAKVPSPYCSIPGLDPYVDWVLRSGEALFFASGQRRMPILFQLRLRGISVRDFLSGRGFIDEERRALWREAIGSPVFDNRPAELLPDVGYGTTFVTSDFFEFLRDAGLQEIFPRVTLGLPLRTESLGPPRGSFHEQD